MGSSSSNINGSQTLSVTSGNERLFLKTRMSSLQSSEAQSGEISTSGISLSAGSVERAIAHAGLGNASVGANVLRLSRATINSVTPQNSPGNNKQVNQCSATSPVGFGCRKTFKDASSDDSFDKDEYDKSKAKYDSGISSPASSLSSGPAKDFLENWNVKTPSSLPDVETRSLSPRPSSRPKLRRDSTLTSSTEVDAFTDETEVPIVKPRIIHVMKGHSDMVTQCHVTKHHVISSSSDATIRIWDVATGNQLSVIELQRPVYDFEYIVHSSNDTLLLAGCEDGKVISYKIIEAGKLICKQVGEYTGHLPNPIRAMALSPDLKHLATGCCFLMKRISDGKIQRDPVVRGTLKIFDLESMIVDGIRNDGHYADKGPEAFKTMHQLVATTVVRRQSYTKRKSIIEEKSWGIRALCYSPDGSKVVVGFGHPDDECLEDEKMIVVVDSKTLEPCWTDSNVSAQVNFLEVPVNPEVYSTPSPVSSSNNNNGSNGTRIEHTKTDLEQGHRNSIVPHSGRFKLLVSTQRSLHKIAFANKGKKLEGKYCWSRSCGEDHYSGRRCQTSRLTVSADASNLIWWDYHTGRRIAKTENVHANIISKLAISPDERLLLTASDDKTLKLWKIPTLKKGQLTA